MLRLILVRHGATDWNVERRCQGTSDVPLSESGLVQADAVAAALADARVDAIFSSDLARARVTAERIAAVHDVNVDLRRGLRELHYGDLEGLTVAEAADRYPDVMELWRQAPADLRLPGSSETLGDMRERAWRVVDEAHDTYPNGQVVVVSHNGPIRAMLTRALDMPVSALHRFRVEPASVTRLQIGGAYPEGVLDTLNDVSHLAHLAVP